MFENILNPNAEAKRELEAEKRAMSFQKEQSAFKAVAQEDNTELMSQEGKSDLIKWQQSLKGDVEELKYKLLGYERNDEGKWEKKHQSMCNELFVHQIIDLTFSAYTSKSFINTNLDERQLLMRLKKTCNNLAKSLITKYKKYAIKFEDFDDIDSEVKNILVPAAFRALKGWTKKTDSTMVKRIESSQENQNEEKKTNMFGFAK